MKRPCSGSKAAAIKDFAMDRVQTLSVEINTLCTSRFVAEDVWEQAEPGSVEKKIAWKCLERLIRKTLASAVTAFQAGELYHEAELRECPTKVLALYRSHWLSFAKQKLALCKTSREVKALHNSANYNTEKIFFATALKKLANKEAPLLAAACKTSEEAKKLWLEAPVPSEAKRIYKKRFWDLADAEALVKAPLCTTVDEVVTLWGEAPFRSPAKKIYLKAWVKLADAEFKNNRVHCTTAKQAERMWQASPPGSKAKEGYRLQYYILGGRERRGGY